MLFKIRKSLERVYIEPFKFSHFLIILIHSIYLILKKLPKEIYNYILFILFYRSPFKYFSNDLSIGVDKLCKQQIHLPHPICLVIGKGVEIGKRCTVYQGVTIGKISKNSDQYPIIGNDVTIYTGAIIIGGIVIGDGSVIGAGRIVSKSIAPGTILKSLDSVNE